MWLKHRVWVRVPANDLIALLIDLIIVVFEEALSVVMLKSYRYVLFSYLKQQSLKLKYAPC